MRARAAILVATFLIDAASAEPISKWQTPDGKLYFGGKPPAGSKLVGKIDADIAPGPSVPETAPATA